jgi:hypothetical protein
MSDKPLTNRKKGEFAVKLNDEWYVLRANFANIALFEEQSKMGVYELAQKVSENKIKMTDVVNVIYCFLDKKGSISQDEIFLALVEAGPQGTIEVMAQFLGIMFNIDEKTMKEAAATALDDNKKKN